MVTFGFDGVEAGGEDRGSTGRRSAGPGTPLAGRGVSRTSSGSASSQQSGLAPEQSAALGEVVVSIGGGETESIGGAADSDPDLAGFHARSSKKEGGRARRPHKPKKTPVMQKTWLKIDSNGITTTVQGDPYKHTHKLGVQTRDLRLLDPNLSSTYPSCILDREKAIVVNLEFIKAIISVDAVLIVNPDDDNVSGFVNDLKAKLSSTMTSAMGPKNVSYTGLSDVAPKLPVSRTAGIELPFELKVLEICLDTVSSHLDQLTSDLEAAAYPPLDALTRQVNEGDLERIRRIKSRLVRLTTRVETIREVLEKFLKDDQDMHNLNLTAQQVQDLARLSRASRQYSMTSQEEAEDDDSHSSDSSEDEAEVAEVEMLLEAYFMLLHNTHNRLQTLHEYITDTEDLVNIKLDSHRNQLITVSVVLTALTASLGVVSAAGGIFGMNLDQTTWLQPKPGIFNVVTLTSSITAIVSFAAFMWWCWREDLLL